MRHLTFTPNPNNQYTVALLIKEAAFKEVDLNVFYMHPMEVGGIKREDCIAFSLQYGANNKTTASSRKAYLDQLLKGLKSLGTKTLLVADAEYFKTLTGLRKADPHMGYVKKSALKGYEGDFDVILIPNFQSLIYNPAQQSKIDMGIKTITEHVAGNFQTLGSNIIKFADYPRTYSDIETWLEKLHQYPALTCDIETFSLNFWETGVGTITFCWNQHEGIAFPVEACIDASSMLAPLKTASMRMLLRKFFETYEGTLIFHNANFDMKILVSSLWMADLLDEPGKQRGIEVLTRNFHDTKLITYLATNSTAGNKLSLKDQAHEFAGNYAQEDINDITKIPVDELLEYNLIDGLCTWYVYNKHWDTLVNDQQLAVYDTIMKPSVKVILQMELTGMPVDMKQVVQARKQLEVNIQRCQSVFSTDTRINDVEFALTRAAWQKDYELRKSKAKNPEKIQPKDFEDYVRNKWVTFNANSTLHLQELLYVRLDLPVIDTTDTKLPAVGGKTIKKLKNHTDDQTTLDLLDTLIDFFDADKILGTFIKALEGAILKPDGWHYLHGNFNLGGTVSGRLSSSGPNLQNLPSTGSKYAKLIKSCFAAPPGWLWVGADYASLEDRISALTTRDPNKLKVYLQGYDGHCLRAYYYYPEKYVGIPETPAAINATKDTHPDERQDSKPVTFLLTYGGTYHGLMNNCGLPEDVAKRVEANYHTLYKVSDEWVQGHIQNAMQTGYVTVAFGMRVRTPLLGRTVMGTKTTPYEAQAEARTAGNALGQSWGMLNNRAGIEFQDKTLNSPHRYDILPSAHIHDAQYFMIRNDVEIVEWMNTELVKSMEWQDDPAIYHPDVKLGGELDIFYPNWAKAYTIPNDATAREIIQLCQPKQEKAA